jgi:two-component system phosphate regulon sensor histidine kinase PhoR
MIIPSLIFSLVILNIIIFFNVSLGIFLIILLSQAIIYFLTYYVLETYLQKSIFDFESPSRIFQKIRYALQQNIMDKERRIELGDKQSLEYQDILNSLDFSLAIIDHDYNLIFVNNIFKEVFQLDKADNLKTDLRDLAFSPELKEVIQKKKKITFDWHRYIPNDRFYEVISFPINKFICIALKDITNVKNLENIRRDFVANVSHELKTPLSSIIGYTETLSITDDAKNKSKFIKTILEQSGRMKSLIEDLLSLSSLENASKLNQNLSCNVHDAIQIAVSSLESAVLAKKIKIILQINEAFFVKCSQKELVQIAINIIDNSIKYSKAGTKITISIRKKLNNDSLIEYVEISFTDEGIGIAEEHIPRLTERFYRTDIARSREVGGTGLGLSIVKHITNNNLGYIDIKSKLGKGSEFLITLPSSMS